MPTRTQAQGGAHAKEDTSDITRVTHDGVRAGVDDLVTTIRLNADSRLKELVYGFRPGDDPRSGKE